MTLNPETLLSIILAIISVSFIMGKILDYLNLKVQKKEVPSEMKGYYDEEKYEKSQRYLSVNTRFSFWSSLFTFILSFMIIAYGIFGWLDQWLRSYIENPVVLSLAFFGIIFIISDIIGLPFQLYGTFVIEEKFGFNKTTPGLFMKDKLKGYILGVIIGGPLLALLLYLIKIFGHGFWIYFWVAISLFTLFMNLFYTSLILPLFNKLTPLGEGELRTAIEDYCRNVKFPLTNIFVMDGSKRSKKSNAFFSGIGKRKKVVLFDTLVENHSKEELVAVLAHEIGHYKKKHIIWGYITSLVQTGLTLFIMSYMIFNENLSLALGGNQLAIHLNLIAFVILFSPISGITGLFMNILSRKNEFEADAYAARTYKGEYLKTALKKLSADNLSNLEPHPAYVFFHYSHPPLLERLRAIV